MKRKAFATYEKFRNAKLERDIVALPKDPLREESTRNLRAQAAEEIELQRQIMEEEVLSETFRTRERRWVMVASIALVLACVIGVTLQILTYDHIVKEDARAESVRRNKESSKLRGESSM